MSVAFSLGRPCFPWVSSNLMRWSTRASISVTLKKEGLLASLSSFPITPWKIRGNPCVEAKSERPLTWMQAPWICLKATLLQFIANLPRQIFPVAVGLTIPLVSEHLQLVFIEQLTGNSQNSSVWPEGGWTQFNLWTSCKRNGEEELKVVPVVSQQFGDIAIIKVSTVGVLLV